MSTIVLTVFFEDPLEQSKQRGAQRSKAEREAETEREWQLKTRKAKERHRGH